MSRSTAPLIARLRRRFLTSAWLFAFLMLAKSVLATSCMGDGFTGPTSSGSALSAEVHDNGMSIAAERGEAACWHGGSAGCHCSCVHGVALPADDVALPSALALSASPDLTGAVFASSPQRTELRPPIA